MKIILLILLLSLVFFIIMTKSFKKTLIIGHRGASGYEPENSLSSFDRAIQMGVDGIELDTYLCKSGEIVVLHDDTIDRTTNGAGKVKELTWDQLKRYELENGEHIPKLSQVFDLINKKIVINIEIKDPDAPEPLSRLILDYVKNKNWSVDNFIVTSFNHQVLTEFRKYCPNVKIGTIFEKAETNPIKIAKQTLANYAIIDYRSATKKIIEQARKSGIKVFAYTVNSQSEAKKLLDLNIDGIITNYPDILKKNTN